MAKVNKKKLIKMIEKLNELELMEEEIETDGDVEDMLSEFMDGVEEIDDDGNIEEVPEEIIDYYESNVDDDDDEDDDDVDDGNDDEDEEESQKKKGKKPAKKKKGKTKDKKKEKSKKKSSKKKSNLPKGFRANTLPASVYEAIKDGDGKCSVMQIAELIAEEKDKEPKKCINMALRIVARKISKAVDVFAKFNGGDESNTILSLESPGASEVDDEDEDDDD